MSHEERKQKETLYMNIAVIHDHSFDLGYVSSFDHYAQAVKAMCHSLSETKDDSIATTDLRLHSCDGKLEDGSLSSLSSLHFVHHLCTPDSNLRLSIFEDQYTSRNIKSKDWNYFKLIIIMIDLTEPYDPKYIPESEKACITSHPAEKWVVFYGADNPHRLVITPEEEEKIIGEYRAARGLKLHGGRSSTAPKDICFLGEEKGDLPRQVLSLHSKEVAARIASEQAAIKHRDEFIARTKDYIFKRKQNAGCYNTTAPQFINNDSANETELLRTHRLSGPLSPSGLQKVLAARCFLNYLENPTRENILVLRRHLPMLSQGNRIHGLAKLVKEYIANSDNKLTAKCGQKVVSLWFRGEMAKTSDSSPAPTPSGCR